MILSRTAASLYWMARYMERAENIARLLNVSLQMSLLPGTRSQEVSTPAAIVGALSYLPTPEHCSVEQVLYTMALDPANPSSICNCIRNARENARMVRGKITAEMWENLNTTWLDMRAYTADDLTGAAAGQLFDWIKERSHLFRGVTYGTMLRGDSFHFTRLGTFLERADNTARILDVKYHRILPEAAQESVMDYYQWAALLHSVSAFEAYRDIYRERITPQRVAEVLILSPNVPRSLRACVEEIAGVLQHIQGDSGHRAKRLAAELHARLSFLRIDEILDEGLHRWLSQFLDDIGRLGLHIQEAYLEAA